MLKFIILAALCMLVKSTSPPYPGECQKVDISFVVDASSSIHQPRFAKGLKFIQNLVDHFNIGPKEVRVSMVTYSNITHTDDAFGFKSYTDKASLKKAIRNMKHHAGDSTQTGAAIRYYLNRVRQTVRRGVRSVVIVMTDGKATNKKELKKESRRARDYGIEVFAIGIGQKISKDELGEIASDGEHVFLASNYEHLNDIKDKLIIEACERDVYPECQYMPIDVSFVIDSSRSITKENFKLEMKFIKDFLDVFEIKPSATRVSAIMFGDRVYSEWAIPFNKYKNKKETLNAIVNLPYMNGGSTETGQGIEYMIKNFKPRPNTHHVGIIITDGESQSTTRTKEAAEKARAAGITTVAVRVGKVTKEDELELQSIAGDSSRVITVTNVNQLYTIRNQLTNVVCYYL